MGTLPGAATTVADIGAMPTVKCTSRPKPSWSSWRMALCRCLRRSRHRNSLSSRAVRGYGRTDPMAFGDLTTLADVKAWLQTGQSAFPSTDDALLTRLITAASQLIQTWLNRKIALQDWIEVRD